MNSNLCKVDVVVQTAVLFYVGSDDPFSVIVCAPEDVTSVVEQLVARDRRLA